MENRQPMLYDEHPEQGWGTVGHHRSREQSKNDIWAREGSREAKENRGLTNRLSYRERLQ